MPNKALRILVADRQHIQRVNVEKILNSMGYYCIAPVGSYDELVALTSPPIHSFDLLIIESSLAAYEGVNASNFCQFNSQVYHSLIYGDRRVRSPEISISRYEAVHVSLPQALNFQSVKSLMAIIDSDHYGCSRSVQELHAL